MWYVLSFLLFEFNSPLPSSLELNTCTVLPSVLCCACIKAAIKGLCLYNSPQIDDLMLENIPCNKFDLVHTQRLIEQFVQNVYKMFFHHLDVVV